MLSAGVHRKSILAALLGLCLLLTVALAFATCSSGSPADDGTIWEPPAWNFLPDLLKATVPHEMLSKIILPGFSINLENTSIRDVASHFNDVIGKRGDAGEFVQWVCLNGGDGAGTWVLWLESGEIEGGMVGSFRWQRLDTGAVLDRRCRKLQEGGVALPNHLRLGLTDSEVLKILGPPTVRRSNRFIYVHEHMESIHGQPYTSLNVVAILFRDRLVQTLDVSKLTSS